MRIFVSSSFEDLREHRAAIIRVLRELGHEALTMEDMTAGSVAPLAKVLDIVDRSEAYVGVFAWHYGYIPTTVPANIPKIDGAKPNETSITHYEYLRALQRKLPVIAFLLDEHYPWPPQFIDGFDKTRERAPTNTDQIRALRQSLQQERVVSWFTTPSDLEARVSAAVTMAGLTRQLDLKEPAPALPPNIGDDTSAESGIRQSILNAGDQQRAFKIDLATTWWSTRLYLIASLANRLTQARRILIVDTTKQTPRRGSPSDPPSADPALPEERFVGQLSTSAILATLGPKSAALGKFEQLLQARPVGYNDIAAEVNGVLVDWGKSFNDDPGTHANEQSAKIDLTATVLRRWFGDALLQQPLRIADLQRASAVDLLRLLDYPNDYVPVLTRYAQNADGKAATERVEVVDVVDKVALNSRLARSYLVELLDRERIVSS